MTWVDEALLGDEEGQGYTQRFEVTRVVHESETPFQKVCVFETPYFGRVLTLDGIVQATERDEPFYHEMLAHVPLLAHGSVGRVLIVGGGDGGVLREVLRHPSVAHATLVDIDGDVIEVCRRHMPTISDGAFDDPRAEVVVGDGIGYVAGEGPAYDVIVVDSTDPDGPGEVLFTEKFYADCHARLSDGGVIVTQSGVPFFQPDGVRNTCARLGAAFADTTVYLTAVPTYIGGFMALGWGTDDPALRTVPAETLEQRFAAARLKTRYYTPEVHRAAFALPPYVRRLMD